jgi:sugar/nucleoside kinase (ribokinase family)
MQTPDVVIVGAATRDIVETDPRGWMLGGGVTFGALALARLGLRVGVVLGLDAEAATACELDLIRDAGAKIIEVPLASGPIFTNVETLAGRIQTCGSLSDPVPVDALPGSWERAPAFVFAPIASEIPEEWVDVPADSTCVAFAWQGILRNLTPGERVTPKPPGPSPFLERADILAFSRHDVPSDIALRDIGAWVGDACDVLLTAGLVGGILLQMRDGRIANARAYPSVPSAEEVDPTGAGDTMLAGLVAARLVAGDDAARHGRDLFTGAAASSLLVEGPGMNSVPTFEQLLERVSQRSESPRTS